jgi:hypothetical protein
MLRSVVDELGVCSLACASISSRKLAMTPRYGSPCTKLPWLLTPSKMTDHPDPEIMRLSLSDLVLRIKIMKVKIGSSIEDVLSQALDPPSPVNIQRAISALVEVRALFTVSRHKHLPPFVCTGWGFDIHSGDYGNGETIKQATNGCSPREIPFNRLHSWLLGPCSHHRCCA